MGELRVIDDMGRQLGVISRIEAMELAREKGLDLVEVAPNAKPPVAKIMDYGKYQYVKKKQERKSKAKAKKGETKGIRIGLKTDSHDLDVKRKRIEKFLNKDFRISVDIILKGREKAFFDKARGVLESFIKSLSTPVDYEEPIKRSPSGFNAVVKASSRQPEAKPQKESKPRQEEKQAKPQS